MKLKYKISTFVEDGATVTEVRDANTFKFIDKIYIGETDWQYNRQDSEQKLKDFISKYEQVLQEES